MDIGAKRLCHLHCEVPDTTSGSKDQHGVAWPNAASLERLGGGNPGERQCGGMSQRDGTRSGGEQARIDCCHLRISARIAAHAADLAEHRIAGRKPVNARPNSDYVARKIGAEQRW